MILFSLHNPSALYGARQFWSTALALLLFFGAASPLLCQESSSQETAAVMAERLWNRALELREVGDRERAANTFLRLFQDYPRSPLAEDALWQTIQYYREVSRTDRQHLNTLEELYRRFVAVYPDSPRSQGVYFDTGLLYYERRFYREALARFRLFLKKFPEAQLASRAEYLSAKTSLNLGQTEEARSLFERYAKSSDPEAKAKGLAGLGEILLIEGKYEQALETIKRSMSLSTDFYLNNPEAEVLRDFGQIYFHMGNEEYGRKHLFHYLNIVGNSGDRLDMLLEIAESFNRQGLSAAAQGIYENIVAEGDETQKAFLIARFRIAHYLDEPENVLSKWQRRGDLADPSGDLPYTALLENIKEGPLAQEARRGLFRRYRARDSFDDALNMTRLYLRELAAAEKDPHWRQTANDMLIYVVEHLVAEEKLKETYEFYKIQHRHVVHFPEGRLLYLVGKALDGLYLYKQAASVYWRALRLPLSEEDKADLYQRRARVYLAMKDFAAADRLLSYLREIYGNGEAAAEIQYLSGKLAEEKKDATGALKFYREAYESTFGPSRRPYYVESYLRSLLAEAKYPAMEKVLLGEEAVENVIDPSARQSWLLRLAEGWETSGDESAAERIYTVSLSGSLPQESREAQKARLQLGDILSRRGKTEEGLEFFNKAATGPDQMLQRLATERLKQMTIDQSMSNLDLPK